jgi:hypothetical protein
MNPSNEPAKPDEANEQSQVNDPRKAQADDPHSGMSDDPRVDPTPDQRQSE